MILYDQLNGRIVSGQSPSVATPQIDPSTLQLGHVVQHGYGSSAVIADIDFETYSEAGFEFGLDNKWRSEGGATKSGLGAVGSMNYSLHESTEVLCIAYDLKDGTGRKLWSPYLHTELPIDLIEFVRNGGLLEAHNSAFEHHIWNNVLHARWGFPPLHWYQQRCSMAKARAFSLAGALDKAAKALNLDQQKDADGKRLIKKFCVPRAPTKKDPRKRILPTDDMADFQQLCNYCLQDIATEQELSLHVPDLIPEELEFWLNTQKANYTGVGVRRAEVEACIAVLEEAYQRYNLELHNLTYGSVSEASKVKQLQEWCAAQGLTMPSFDDAALKDALKLPDLPPHVRRALEIRKMIGSAGVKKVYAMDRLATPDGRLCDMFVYHGARTGRDTGADVQPQNLVKRGPKLMWCTECEHPFGQHHKEGCPWCGASVALFAEKRKDGDWTWEAVDHAITVLSSHSLDLVEHVFGDAVLTVSGCIRGLFVAGEGKTLICSDYSAIEAVVAAQLAGEEWRLETFRKKIDIYLASASQITGRTLEEYAEYQKTNGAKHPDRQKIGKVAELALGYAGSLGAWRNFDKTDTYTDQEVYDLIRAWREKSPMIVEMWGGQSRVRGVPDYFGLEGMAILAVANPNTRYSHREVAYECIDDILYCILPSGRRLTYHQPRVLPSIKRQGQMELSFMGYNSNPAMGAIGWVRITTFGGRLFENVVQAVSRDIMRDATNRLERAGYPIVLRVHDELVAEVPIGFGSIEEFESLMSLMPSWAAGYPVRAAGGWSGSRYRKD